MRASPAHQVEDGPARLTEGKARLVLPGRTGAGSVFYNPRMSLNRDLAILFAQSYFARSRHLRVCDPMCGSGVRAVRYLLELPHASNVVGADRDPIAVKTALAAVRLNGLEDMISIVESDANLLLSNHGTDRFDLVDLDPFGSPAPFFESALRATIDDGVIAATATDMGPLTGARASACLRKYGVTSTRTEFGKEVAARTLVGCLAGIAVRLNLGVNIVFTHVSDHYARVYAAVTKGKPQANCSTKSLGFLEYCAGCLRRDLRSSLQLIRIRCGDCGGRKVIIGPLWLGKLWNPYLVRRMIDNSPMLVSQRLSEIQMMLSRIGEECEASPFYYRTDALSARITVKPPRLEAVLDALQREGYTSTRTHFDPNGFRTDAPNLEVASVVRSLTNKPQA